MGLPLGFAGAIAGGLGGLAGHRPKPPRNPAMPSLYEGSWIANEGDGPKYDSKGKQIAYKNDEDLAYAYGDFGNLRGFLNDRMGGVSFFDDEDRDYALNPGRANIASEAAVARERANERAVGSNFAPGSGMLEQSLGEIDRSELGANRALFGQWATNEATLRAQAAQAAAAQMQGLLMGDQSFRAQQQQKEWEAKVARSQAPKMWQDILGGAVGGFLGMAPMGGGSGGGGGLQSAQMDSGDWGPSYAPSTFGFQEAADATGWGLGSAGPGPEHPYGMNFDEYDVFDPNYSPNYSFSRR